MLTVKVVTPEATTRVTYAKDDCKSIRLPFALPCGFNVTKPLASTEKFVLSYAEIPRIALACAPAVAMSCPD